MAQKLHAGSPELALVHVQQKAALTQPLQNQAEMVEVCLLVRTGNEDVVLEDKDKVQAGHQPVHQTLERLASILQTKGHAQKLPKAKRSDDSRLGNVLALTGTW